MDFIDQIILLIVSLLANFFSALAGGGAGLLQLPALIFLGLPFSIALATHKVASVALGLGATIRHMRESRLEKTVALIILMSGLPGVLLGANIILLIPERTAQISLGILTILLGIYSLLKPDLGIHKKNLHLSNFELFFGSITLFFIGFLNGSLTSGTGLFCTLWLVRWFGIDYKTAVAYTLIFVGVFWNGLGALTLGFLSEIRWLWLPALMIGSLIGGYLGAHFAIKKGIHIIKRVFEMTTLLVGCKLIYG